MATSNDPDDLDLLRAQLLASMSASVVAQAKSQSVPGVGSAPFSAAAASSALLAPSSTPPPQFNDDNNDEEAMDIDTLAGAEAQPADVEDGEIDDLLGEPDEANRSQQVDVTRNGRAQQYDRRNAASYGRDRPQPKNRSPSPPHQFRYSSYRADARERSPPRRKRQRSPSPSRRYQYQQAPRHPYQRSAPSDDGEADLRHLRSQEQAMAQDILRQLNPNRSLCLTAPLSLCSLRAFQFHRDVPQSFGE